MIGTHLSPITGPFHCIECGYDLEGHHGADASAVCPECGKPVRESDPAVVHDDFVRSYLPTFRGGLGILLATHILASMLFVLAGYMAFHGDADLSYILIVITMTAIPSVIAMRKLVRPHPLLNRSASVRWFARSGRTISIAPLLGALMAIVSLGGPVVWRLYAGCALLLAWLPCATITFMHIAAVCRCVRRPKLAAMSDIVAWWLSLTLTIPVCSVLWSGIVDGEPSARWAPIVGILFIVFFPGYVLALLVIGLALGVGRERRNFFRAVP